MYKPTSEQLNILLNKLKMISTMQLDANANNNTIIKFKELLKDNIFYNIHRCLLKSIVQIENLVNTITNSNNLSNNAKYFILKLLTEFYNYKVIHANYYPARMSCKDYFSINGNRNKLRNVYYKVYNMLVHAVQPFEEQYNEENSEFFSDFAKKLKYDDDLAESENEEDKDDF